MQSLDTVSDNDKIGYNFLSIIALSFVLLMIAFQEVLAVEEMGSARHSYVSNTNKLSIDIAKNRLGISSYDTVTTCDDSQSETLLNYLIDVSLYQSDLIYWPFPCNQKAIPVYTAHYVSKPPEIDGQLDEKVWQEAPTSPRFVDLISGRDPIYDTHVSVLWDDENLYIGFWLEEPMVEATLTERNDPLYNENNAEVFIAGQDAYYEFEINALGTIYEAFFIWEEAYKQGGFDRNSAFQKNNTLVKEFNGVGYNEHPRGPRLGSWDFRFPGLKSEVKVDGKLNDDSYRDRGWTIELAFPWSGMYWLAKADQRPLPPKNGNIWRIDFSRFNAYKEAPPAEDSGGWSLSSHGIWDSHIPECFPFIIFSEDMVDS